MAGAADSEGLQLHFVLIHGSCHGAWSWYRLEDQLQKTGFKVSSMDLASSGIHPADPDTITTWDEYHKPALDFFASLPERAPQEKIRLMLPCRSITQLAALTNGAQVVLVGHSMGGMANLMLTERFPHKIDVAVFVAAIVTPSGVPFWEDVPLLTLMGPADIVNRYENGPENAPTSFYWPTSELQRVHYSGLDSEITVLATKLVRPSPSRVMATPITYTKENHGRVPAVYIRYSHDHAVHPDVQDYMVTRHGTFREVVHLAGGHFDFLQRPAEFTRLLAQLAHQYCADSSP